MIFRSPGTLCFKQSNQRIQAIILAAVAARGGAGSASWPKHGCAEQEFSPDLAGVLTSDKGGFQNSHTGKRTIQRAE